MGQTSSHYPGAESGQPFLIRVERLLYTHTDTLGGSFVQFGDGHPRTHAGAKTCGGPDCTSGCGGHGFGWSAERARVAYHFHRTFPDISHTFFPIDGFWIIAIAGEVLDTCLKFAHARWGTAGHHIARLFQALVQLRIGRLSKRGGNGLFARFSGGHSRQSSREGDFGRVC